MVNLKASRVLIALVVAALVSSCEAERQSIDEPAPSARELVDGIHEAGFACTSEQLTTAEAIGAVEDVACFGGRGQATFYLLTFLNESRKQVVIERVKASVSEHPSLGPVYLLHGLNWIATVTGDKGNEETNVARLQSTLGGRPMVIGSS